MTRPRDARGGVAAILLTFAVALGGAGLAFDLLLSHERGFWAGAEPGARALIGAATGVAMVGVAHLMRLLLGRRK